LKWSNVLWDREKWGIADGQIGFFNFAIVPTFEVMARFLPETQSLLETVKENLQFWENVKSGSATFVLEDIPYDITNVFPPATHSLVSRNVERESDSDISDHSTGKSHSRSPRRRRNIRTWDQIDLDKPTKPQQVPPWETLGSNGAAQ